MAKRSFDFGSHSVAEVSDRVSDFLKKKYSLVLSASEKTPHGVMLTASDKDQQLTCSVCIETDDNQTYSVEVSDLKVFENGVKDTLLTIVLTALTPWLGVPYAGMSLLSLNRKLQLPGHVFSFIEGML